MPSSWASTISTIRRLTARSKGAWGARWPRSAASPLGSNRSGTTSLYNYLVQHPSVARAFTKEAHFFDLRFEKGQQWYRGYFSTFLARAWAWRVRGRPFVTGEASPDYLFHPQVPRRVFETLPRVRLIAILRNPLDRAYSQYQQQVRKGREPRS